MLRRILNNIMETSLQPVESILYPVPFTKMDVLHFNWLSDVAPCFPVNASNIKILTEPKQFYKALVDNSRIAKDRITLVSLYLGTGTLEKDIVNALIENPNFKENNLKVNFLLDYTRGSRYQTNSRTVLQPLLNKNDKNCRVSLYHTPVLRGLFKKYTPNRWNEIYGLQHMKLYIFDNTLIISGANLSNEYFLNRQDRYFVINDKKLCDFYCGLINKVQRFSLNMDKNNNVSLSKNWKYSPFEGDKEEFVERSGDLVEQYLMDWKDEQNSHKKEGFDTWIYPMVQMAQLGVEQDSQVTERILAEAPENSRLHLATGYFNLTSQYTNTLIRDSKGICNILMAHPEANGFLGAAGAAGGIPSAYSLIAYKFKQQFQRLGQQNRLNMLEYLRNGWTYHGKGLWYYPPNGEYPCLTLIGSPNFGERSVKKDLETQLAIVTENEELRKELHNECRGLYELGVPEETDRTVPYWIYVMVYLFRDYF